MVVFYYCIFPTWYASHTPHAGLQPEYAKPCVQYSARDMREILKAEKLPPDAIKTLINDYKCDTRQKLAELSDDFVLSHGKPGLQGDTYVDAIQRARDAARFELIKLAFDELRRKGIWLFVASLSGTGGGSSLGALHARGYTFFKVASRFRLAG